jgi:hypothetical protein
VGAILTPPGSSVGIELADDLVERYEAQGWTRVDSEPAEKYLSQQNKAELVATANALGLDADESLSKKDLVELIESARAEQ